MSTTTKSDVIRALLGNLESFLNEISYERSREIELIIAVIVARQHMFMLGPPGVAKSYILEELSRCVEGRCFKKLFSAMTELSEVLGPIDLKAFEQENELRFNYKDMLPDAHFFLADEVFKANSVLLNALLELLNERRFTNGSQRVNTALVSAFGASNELPQEGLEAFYDRFLVRTQVLPIQDPLMFAEYARGGHIAAKRRWENGEDGRTMPKLTLKMLEYAAEEASKVLVTPEFANHLSKLRQTFNLKHGDVQISDRRWGQAVQFAKASAWIAGREKLVRNDLFYLRDCLWDEPSQRGPIQNTIAQACDHSLADFQTTLNDIRAAIATARQASRYADAMKHQTAINELDKIMLAMLENDPSLGLYCRAAMQQLQSDRRQLKEHIETLVQRK